MPANTGVNQGRASAFNSLSQLHDLRPNAATLDQIKHRQAVNNDEVLANGFTHAAHDLNRQTHAIFVAAAPTVSALIGMRSKKLVNEVAFRTHDLDTVITGAASQFGARYKVADLLLDTRLIQRFRRERVNRRLNGTRRHLLGAVGITPGVENLQTDFATRIVNGLRHDHVLFSLLSRRQLGCAAVHPTLFVRCNPPRHNQPNPTFGALGKIGGHALKATWFFFKAGVHRAHEAAIAQCGKTQIKRGHQMRVVNGSHHQTPQQAKSRNAGRSVAPVVECQAH